MTMQICEIAIETDTALAATYDELATLARKQTAAPTTACTAPSATTEDRRLATGDTATRPRRLRPSSGSMRLRTRASRSRRPSTGSGRPRSRSTWPTSAIDELDRIYNEHRWNRYFLVTNTNGHVHRNMGCSTCFPTTEYAWLVELADCDEDAMIIEFGEKACTVCFPDAPANPQFNGPGRRDREAQAARQAEKDARQAVKNAKRLAADEVFRTRYMSDRVETVAALQGDRAPGDRYG